MDVIRFLIDFILHIDVHRRNWSRSMASGFMPSCSSFCSVKPVWSLPLPAGDSLLFVAGALSALPTNDLNVHLMVVLMVIAAIIGDAVNYTIGRVFGERLFSNPDSRIFRRSYLDKTHAFYERHGGKPLSLRVLCLLCAHLHRLWREWGICPIVILRCITSWRAAVGAVVYLCRLPVWRLAGGSGKP